MADFTNVCIGIQARSSSTRLPRKCFELLGGKPVLQHVIDACVWSARYMNRRSSESRTIVSVSLLIPTGDPIKAAFRGDWSVIEGSEEDVLSRYHTMATRMNADYIVRVTGDCPLIPSFLITKHIKTAMKNDYDYVSNVDEKARTAPDGFDCEVISRSLLEYVNTNATELYDREHVTTYIRNKRPEWAKVGHVVNFIDLSHVKLSLDTPEDLERIRNEYARQEKCRDEAERMSGRQNVHSF